MRVGTVHRDRGRRGPVDQVGADFGEFGQIVPVQLDPPDVQRGGDDLPAAALRIPEAIDPLAGGEAGRAVGVAGVVGARGGMPDDDFRGTIRPAVAADRIAVAVDVFPLLLIAPDHLRMGEGRWVAVEMVVRGPVEVGIGQGFAQLEDAEVRRRRAAEGDARRPVLGLVAVPGELKALSRSITSFCPAALARSPRRTRSMVMVLLLVES